RSRPLTPPDGGISRPAPLGSNGPWSGAPVSGLAMRLRDRRPPAQNVAQALTPTAALARRRRRPGRARPAATVPEGSRASALTSAALLSSFGERGLPLSEIAGLPRPRM